MLTERSPTVTELQRQRVHGVSPTVGQVEGDAALDVCTKAYVADGSQADVEEGDDAHSQVQHQEEALWLLHLVLQRENLAEQTDLTCTPFIPSSKTVRIHGLRTTPIPSKAKMAVPKNRG